VGDVVSISVHTARKMGDPSYTEEEAAVQRGIAAWKRQNWKMVEARNEAIRTARRARRQQAQNSEG
jgi:hypothetical protein